MCQIWKKNEVCSSNVQKKYYIYHKPTFFAIVFFVCSSISRLSQKKQFFHILIKYFFHSDNSCVKSIICWPKYFGVHRVCIQISFFSNCESVNFIFGSKLSVIMLATICLASRFCIQISRIPQNVQIPYLIHC